MNLYSFQDTEFKLHRYLNVFTGQVVERLTILPCPWRGQEYRVNNSKTEIWRAFAQFSRYIVETSQIRQRLHGTGRDEGDGPTVPRRGQELKINHSKYVNLTCIRTIFKIQSWHFKGTSATPRTGRAGVDDSNVPQRSQEWRINYSKRVNSTCIRTVFKIQSSNFTETLITPRDRSWRGRRFVSPEESGIKD